MDILKYHSEEVFEAVKLTGSYCEELSEADSNMVLNNVIALFTKDTGYNYPLWERIINSVSIRLKYAWEKFDEMFRGREVILFFCC